MQLKIVCENCAFYLEITTISIFDLQMQDI